MRTFFLFYILSSLLGNPLLALLIIGAMFYFAESRYSGRYFNPFTVVTARSQRNELRRQLEINPHDVGAHNDLGRILAENGEYSEALPHMESAIARMDDSAEANYYLGLCQVKQGQVQAGIDHIKACLSINGTFGYGKPQLSLARVMADLGEVQQARDYAAQAVQINTSAVEGWVLLAEAHLADGNRTEARKALESAVQAYDHSPRYLKLSGRSFARRARKLLRTV